ncbi:selenocysteine-specific translation elongation factor [Carboxydothermus hydrogenoformans]|uniref:Selenocysteine-specific elongation factor n=1 Tax=Carboxydothermus hydrogenoformans (strain ATCC BAA-161 / DSM 6008 / Z-2901) TaxID=246194 RepID=Q3AB62_CARHZ|nr:selenocysteine-specific translation elongation factor [Carboxydothermus hydrogenoformans]ABB14917.1 selenocysteine-specific translation elongation factor [Carboxydothermus hydrogenoformans Z-2901]
MKYFIIGTAGHVDHGKTELIKRLTGIDTDRLKEEKKRGISIELGFAHLTLPSGKKAGIVDVPGHERFIKNMLAGVMGFDMVLLVIAADEGIMPQTREHMDILKLLQIKKGIVVVTKKDLVDEDWLNLVIEDIKEFVKGSFLEKAPIIPVSSITGEGISTLLAEIDRVAEEVEEKSRSHYARLPIDRVFTIAGFGTVVTGTLWSGELAVGETVEILPRGLTKKIRNLQVHGQKVERAFAGQRVAINLADVEVKDIERGDWVVTIGVLKPTRLLDVKFTVLASQEKPVRHRQQIRFYLGTAERLGRVLLLDREELEPGGETYAQLMLEEPVVADRFDRFIIRSYSPMVTIGGGEILDPYPARKYKRFREDVMESLKVKEKGEPSALVLNVLLNSLKPLEQKVIEQKTTLAARVVEESLNQLIAANKVYRSGEKLYFAADNYAKILAKTKEFLQSYHHQYPLRAGVSKDELKSKLFNEFSLREFTSFLEIAEEKKELKVSGNKVALIDYVPRLTAELEKAKENILNYFKKASLMPENLSAVLPGFNLKEDLALELINYLVEQGELIKIDEEIYLAREHFEEAMAKIKKLLLEKKEIVIADVRELLGISRKYALPLLETLDQLKITRRVGDKRVLARRE